MNRLFVVSYEIDYVHRVSVGITAGSPGAAQQIAEQAFNDATILDDTAAMPLLSDDYHELPGLEMRGRSKMAGTGSFGTAIEEGTCGLAGDWLKPINKAKPMPAVMNGTTWIT